LNRLAFYVFLGIAAAGAVLLWRLSTSKSAEPTAAEPLLSGGEAPETGPSADAGQPVLLESSVLYSPKAARRSLVEGAEAGGEPGAASPGGDSTTAKTDQTAAELWAATETGEKPKPDDGKGGGEPEAKGPGAQGGPEGAGTPATAAGQVSAAGSDEKPLELEHIPAGTKTGGTQPGQPATTPDAAEIRADDSGSASAVEPTGKPDGPSSPGQAEAAEAERQAAESGGAAGGVDSAGRAEGKSEAATGSGTDTGVSTAASLPSDQPVGVGEAAGNGSGGVSAEPGESETPELEPAFPSRIEEVDQLVLQPPAEQKRPEERWVASREDLTVRGELPVFKDTGPPPAETLQPIDAKGVTPATERVAGGAEVPEDMSQSDAATVVIRPVRQFEPEKFLYDTLDGPQNWGLESAEDNATLSPSQEQSSEGPRSLKVSFEDGQKGTFEIRREVSLKLPEKARFTVDIFNASKPMHARMFVYASTSEWRRLETKDVRVEPGWNRALGFEFCPEAFEGEARSKWLELHQDVMRVGWQFRKGENESGVVYLDNVRMSVDPAEAEQRPRRPIVLGVQANKDKVESHAWLELKVDAMVTSENAFDVKKTGLVGMFISPSGKKWEVNGFVYDQENGGKGRPDFRIRFSPDEPGPWSYVVRGENENGKTMSERAEFECIRENPRPGMLRISKRDPMFFEFDNGDFFYPIGQNVAWAGKHGAFFGPLSKQGANCARIWLCPWHLQLEGPQNPGRYDLSQAKYIDAILAAAEEAGIYILLVIEYHGMLQGDWPKNPYNQANGGPLANAWDFFTNAQAKDLFKRRLDYIVARWGHSTAVFAWELWNEVDLTSNWDQLVTKKKFAEIVSWHSEIAGYLKSADPYRHLVTTSTSNTNQFDEIYKLKEIDFVPKHFYTEKIIDEVVGQYEKQKAFEKPYFVGEFSAGTDPRTDQNDPTGIRLHSGLWASFMTPTAGSAMPWWWDIHVQKYDLYHHFKALAAFAEGEDRRGRTLEFLAENVAVNDNLSVDVLGFYDRSGACLWIYNRQAAQDDLLLSRLPVLPAPAQVALGGLIAGVYRVEIWDTYEGKVLQAERRETDGQGLVISIPRQVKDVAVKIRKLDRVVSPTIRFLK
jgi:hypothetical protein